MGFPLLKLPNKAIRNVKRNLSIYEIFYFSFVSTKAKNLLKFRDLRPEKVKISVGSNLNIVIHLSGILILELFDSSTGSIDINNETLKTIKSHFGAHLNFENSTLSQFLDHLKSIFGSFNISEISFSKGSDKFDFDQLHKIFPNYGTLKIYRFLSNALSQQVLKIFTNSKALALQRNPYDGTELQNILARNLNRMVLGGFDETIKLTLEDLMMSNVRSLTVYGAETSDRDFNRFVKFWIKSRSKSRVQCLVIYSDRDQVDRDEILEGIDFIEIPKTRERWIDRSFGENLAIQGGFDIRRRDGTVGTIVFDLEDEDDIQFIVWD